jgi:hypothetical protein
VVGDRKIALVDNGHADQNIAIAHISFRYRLGDERHSVRKENINDVSFGLIRPVYTVGNDNAGSLQVTSLHYPIRNNAACGARVPNGMEAALGRVWADMSARIKGLGNAAFSDEDISDPGSLSSKGPAYEGSDFRRAQAKATLE